MILVSRILNGSVKVSRHTSIKMFSSAPSVGVHQKDHATRECEEVKIKFHWGEIAAKWWGPQNVRPILALHGWQDNAGTFDTLAPLLPPHVGLLAVDFPGHGLSSRIPDGMFYNSIDALLLINLIKKEYDWDKVSLMGHSMGSVIGFVYSAMYPQNVDIMIGLDALKPHIMKPNTITKKLRERLENFQLADERNLIKAEPPSYEYDVLVDRMQKGTAESLSKESCNFLLARAITKSSQYPHKYYFHRDSRLKYLNWALHTQEQCLEMVKEITAPYLFFKCSGSPYYEDEKYFMEAKALMEQTNPKFEYHTVTGSHHLHLNEPQVVSGKISDFINKYRPALH